MARDGTNHGGRRIRAGDKPEAHADKIAGGRVMQWEDMRRRGTDQIDSKREPTEVLAFGLTQLCQFDFLPHRLCRFVVK